MRIISIKKSNNFSKLPLVRRQKRSLWELICLLINIDGNIMAF